MSRIFALAHITFLNGLRKNAVWGLCIFALLIELFGILFMDFFGRDLGRVVSDFQFSIMFAAGMIFILFYAVQAIAWDENHRTIDSILARPISRVEYVLGSMSGLALLLLCFELLLGGLALGELIWIRPVLGEAYFPVFSPGYFMLAWFALLLALLVHLGVVVLISSAVRGAFPVMLITLSYALICSGLPIVREAMLRGHEGSADMLPLLQGLGLVFPDFSMLDLKDAVVSEQALAGIIGMPVWMPFSLMGLYLALVLLFACMVYQRRDIL